MTLYELFYFLFRNKWMILAGILAGLIAAGVVYARKPRVYRSEATLLVRYVSDTVVVDPEVSGERVLTPGTPNETVIGTEVDILYSSDLLVSAARALADAAAANTNRTLIPMTAQQLAGNFRVQVAKNSSTIRISLDGPSPESAQRGLDELIKAYLAKHQEVHRDPGAFDFISRQTDEKRAQVNDAEDELRRIKSEAGIVSVADSRAAIAARIQDLDRGIRDRESALAANRARMQILSNQITRATLSTMAGGATGRTVAARSPELDDVYFRIAALGRRESELLRTYTTNSLPVRSIRQQIDELRRSVGLAADPGRSTNTVHDGLTRVRPTAEILATEFATLQAEEAAVLAQLMVLQKQMEAARAESKRTENVESQIARLERAREVADANFRYFSQRLEHARIDSAMDASKVSNIPLVQPPSFPERPLMRDLLKLLALILAGCTGCGVALAFTREYVLDHSIRHPYTIPRALEVPLLAALPCLKRPGRRWRLADSRPSKLSGEAEAVQAWLASCEVIGHIVQHVASRQEKQSLRIGIVAPHHGAGVTLIAGKIADAIHMSGSKRVLLATVSGDGMLAARELGAASIDTEAQELMAKPTQPGQEPEEWIPVRIPFSAPAPMTPRLMEELLRQEHDIILYDLPPLSASEHAVRLLPQLHGVILVAETFRTTVSEAHACIGLIQQLQCPVYGVVLNKFASPLPRWLTPPPSPPAAAPPVAALPPAMKMDDA